MYDLLIRNGTIIDGSGAPRYHADIAVQQGRIAHIGKIADSARNVIDASDLIVAPGFIDPHTHYDAQICWDRLPTPSAWHGVTTAMMGNCGVGLAPVKPEAREIAAWDLVNVEAIPYDVLAKGVTWDWETFPQYMDAAARRGSGINLGFLCALTPFRHYVMGEAAMDRAATAEETARIKTLLKDSLRHGAFGFTTSVVGQHIGYQGRPLACRNASRDELKAYANALKEVGHGAIELALTSDVAYLSQAERELLELLLTESNANVTWLAMLDRSDNPAAVEETLRAVQPLIQRGGLPQTSCRPFVAQVDLKVPFMFANMPCWNPVFNRPVTEQKKVLSDPAFRAEFREELKRPKIFSAPLGTAVPIDIVDPKYQHLEGRSVTDIARERGVSDMDAFLDVAIDCDLQMQYYYEAFNSNEQRVGKMVADPRILIGLSDGGAHVDMFSDAGYCTYLLGHWVREKNALSLEHAVKRITSEPAAFFGIKQRGHIAVGMAADFAIFDATRVGSNKRGEMQHDLPGGGRRLVTPARGIEYTIVNGAVLFERGAHSGALPGQVLRSGSA